MQLAVVRHGRTAWNAERRFQGWTDVPLDEEGRAQARSLALLLRTEHFDYAVSSDLSRARETAEIILADRSTPLAFDAGWREMRFGTWEGLTWEEIAPRYPAWSENGEAPFPIPEGGESFDELCSRIQAAVRRLQAEACGDALIATHAGPLHALARLLLGKSEQESLGMRFAPGSVTRFTI